MELYIHFPFCRRKCRYCDFVSFSGLEYMMEAYADAVLREAELFLPDVTEPIETIYFGGGTPSLIPSSVLKKILSGLKQLFPIRPGAEFTSEANPGTLTREWLETALEGGVNRLSLGMQSAQAELLRLLGRIHSFADVEKSVLMARQAGFQNMNLDLIFGIPGQSGADWTESLEAALRLKPEHLSCYGLIPEEGTPIWNDLRSGVLVLPEEEAERKMYTDALRITKNHGLEQYEISNFAKSGFACRHNIGYWDQVPYLGLGVSAASMIRVSHDDSGMRYFRRTNTDLPETYLEGIRKGHPVWKEQEWIQPAEARFETMMLGLRMNRGVSEDVFLKRHGVSVTDVYGDKLIRLVSEGLIRYDSGFWKLTEKGMDLQNQVLVDLME